MIGAFVSAALIQTAADSRAEHGVPSRRYIVPFWLVAALLGVATLIPAGALPREAMITLSVPFQSDLFSMTPATLLLLGLLALACGMQNNLFLVERNLVFRTTHLTGTTSDLATHLARIAFKSHSTPEARQYEGRLALIRAVTILAFFCGAAAGFVTHRAVGRLALCLPLANAIAVALFVTVYFDVKPRLDLAARASKEINRP